MRIKDFEYLLWRMRQWEEAAFVEFDEVLSEYLVEWLFNFGLSKREVYAECPRCLLEIGILAVRRRDEIEPGRFLTWCHVQTRNLVVRYWREKGEEERLASVLTTESLREMTDRLDGSPDVYRSIAKRLQVPCWWLKNRHQKLQLAMSPRADWKSQSQN